MFARYGPIEIDDRKLFLGRRDGGLNLAQPSVVSLGACFASIEASAVPDYMRPFATYPDNDPTPRQDASRAQAHAPSFTPAPAQASALFRTEKTTEASVPTAQ